MSVLSLNQKIFTFIHNWSGIDPSLDRIIIFCAVHLWWVLAACILVFYAIFKRTARGLAELSVVFFSGGLSYVATYITKHLMESPRPIEVLKDLPVLLQNITSSAFPSGHTALVFGLAVALFLYDWFLGTVALILALLVGLSRVAAGVHWPIDILGGMAVGAIVAFLVHALASIFLHNKKESGLPR